MLHDYLALGKVQLPVSCLNDETNVFHCLIIKIHQLLLQRFNESPFIQLQ